MKIAVCDCRMPKAAFAELKKYCGKIILLPPSEVLSEPVSAHPDMLIFPCVNEGIIYTHPSYLQRVKDAFSCTGFDILPIEEKAEKEYPRDILLNAATVGKNIFGRLPYVSNSIKEYAKRNGFELIDVKQGYTKCSVCKVSENAVITADTSIANAAKKQGIDMLKINEGFISLPGYDCGFIGGASGFDNENVYFCGDIESHPDASQIISFCSKHSKAAVSLSSEPLFDVGSIFIFDRKK